MRKLLLVLACICLAEAVQKKKKEVPDHLITRPDYAYASHESGVLVEAHLTEAEPISSGHLREHVKPGYSVGGPLASIAKGAAEQAHIQLSNQYTAAGQAAYVAKKTLAQAASQSADTAATALTGKQIILLGLEQQSRDAHVAVENEKLQLHQAEKAASAAQQTAHQANHQVTVLTAALNAAQETADHANKAAAEAAAELASQTSMVGQAKARAEAISEQVTAARFDYETTHAAAHKAATAAAAAHNNAAADGAHVADSASASVLLAHTPEVIAPLPHVRNQHGHTGFIHGEPISLSNTLPIDGYEYKAYQY